MEPNKQTEREEMEIDLSGLLRLFRQKIKQMIVIFLAFAVLAGAASYFFIAPKYQAVSKIYIISSTNDAGVNMSDLQIGATLTADYKQLLLSRPILEGVLRNTNIDVNRVEDLRSMIQIDNPQGTRILNIVVTGTNPNESAKIANELARMAKEQLPQMMGCDAPYVAEEAVIPRNKVGPSNAKNAILGGLVALLIYLVIETIKYVRDDTVQNSEEFERYFGIVPLAAIPKEDVVDYHDKGVQKGKGTKTGKYPASSARPAPSKGGMHPVSSSKGGMHPVNNASRPARPANSAARKPEQKKGTRQV